ncbi:DcaP family trimeric outer membrane transporter [Acinetobacter shaoyimingii]|uniref:DcaP-like protein n=1 Tax=Acinetobacter shaoyimingii TaxID=2715164 RepID=A0A6G8RXT1_9GAMM|nr:DcaP family trimeric outer membrane transporter [Acinetobacter shaoyimingii]NHB57637.1 DcaP-like protein [Acinetobacter shaoyimingii]QIO06660.1 DcaP-like protein [Acinetobacter shaoyimingii]
MGRLTRGQFLKQGLAVAVTAVLMSSANAATEKEEIQQLRQEVEALKSLIKEQQQVQQKQQVQLAEVASQPAKAPVAVKSKAGANVDIYGFVRADAGYQFKGGAKTFNHIHEVDLQANQSNDDKLYATAKTTRIGLDFKAPVEGADVGGKVEVDFADTPDDKNAVRIRHAYVTYNNWLFGQTTSSFVSTETQPEMLDFGSPLGIGTYRTPQVRFTDKINANTRYFVGLEKGNDSNRLPALTGKIAHNFADGAGVVTGRALVQEVRARNVNDAKEFGWGVGLGLNFKPIEQLILNADYSHISGDDKFLLYTGGNTNQGRWIQDGNDIDLNDLDAFTVGATYKINPKLRSTLGYGAVFFGDAAGALNDNLQQGWLNIMYNPVKPITFGAEYVYGERETADDQIGRDSRFGLMAKYDF